MRITRTGFILYVEEYEACVAFYRDALELRTMFDTPDLTCFDFGGSYLMVERVDGDDDRYGRGAMSTYPTCLRMNVPDVRACADALVRKGVEVDYQQHEWGSVAKFVDPAGNLCAFKDDEKFERQIAEAEGR